MKALRLHEALALLFLLALAVAVTGCEEWDWLLSDDGKEDTNITVTVFATALVSDLNGNYPDGVNVHFTSGASSGGSGQVMDRLGVLTEGGGEAKYVCTFKIDKGDHIWVVATTGVAGQNPDSSLYSARAVVTYEDAWYVKEYGRASVPRTLILRLPPTMPIVNDVGHKVRDVVDSLMNNLPPSQEEQLKERPKPSDTTQNPPQETAHGLKAGIQDFGVSNTAIKQGENLTAFVVLENTGDVPIEDVKMVGTLCEQKRDGKYVPMQVFKIPLSEVVVDLGNIKYNFTGENIAPGQQKKLEITKEVPKQYGGVNIPNWAIRGHYKLIVRVTAVDENGSTKDVGVIEKEFDIVKSEDGGLFDF